VGTLEWLGEQTGTSTTTMYRQAKVGALAEFGVFKVGAQYRVSKPRALRAIHGATGDSKGTASEAEGT
jgi:hypothetical protein